ncbi:MAG: hypothetical protein BAJALOKI1v1_660022 [Promethearchaeota archaeon]|nr:MAG: hypothetical protein BAJALOKI1v1_660022 [Candidatus Lokiarchaeota archaeon]
MNNKPIMAVIHPFVSNFMEDIVHTYLDLDIDLFCFNFEGSGLSNYFANYFQLLRELHRYDKNRFDQRIKYVINLRLPSNRYRNQPFPAEDMITPALATDIIGINHIAGGFRPKPKPSRKKKKSKGKRQKSNTNLIEIETYNYQRIASMDDFSNVFQKPLITPKFRDFQNASYQNRNDFRRKFNYLNSNMELQVIHKKIRSNIPIIDTLRNKSGVQSDLMSKWNILDDYIHSYLKSGHPWTSSLMTCN